ncbi:tetratricopeptide repeat protein [candidate division KSB1 bacterium]
MSDQQAEKGDLLRQAIQLLRRGDKKEAGAVVETWLKSGRGRPGDFDRAGSVLFKVGRLDKAAACYRRVLADDPDYLPVYNNLATLYNQRGEHEKAIELIEEGLKRLSAIRADKKAPPPAFDVDESLDILRQAIGSPRSAPEKTDVPSGTRPAPADDDLSDLVRRAAEMKPAAEGAPRTKPPLTAGTESDSLIARLEKERVTDETAGGKLLELAEAYLDKGDAERALEVCRGLLDNRPADPVAHECLGRILQSLNQPQEALENFMVALELDSDFPEAWLGKGQSLLELKRFAEAFEVASETVDRGVISGDAYILLATAAVELNREAEAREAFQRAFEVPLDLKPEYARFVGLMFELGIGNLALSLAQDLVRLYPDDPEVTRQISHHLPDLLS